MGRRPLLGVIGDGGVPEEDLRFRLARELGCLGVEHGFRIVCGGLGGVMEAVCRGAHDASSHTDGDTIGILPGDDAAEANPWVDIVLPTGMSHLRNALVAHSDVVVAIGGGAGTLSEMAFAWIHRRPIIALGDDGWAGRLAGQSLDDRRPEAGLARIVAASNAKQAVELALRLLGESRRDA